MMDTMDIIRQIIEGEEPHKMMMAEEKRQKEEVEELKQMFPERFDDGFGSANFDYFVVETDEVLALRLPTGEIGIANRAEGLDKKQLILTALIDAVQKNITGMGDGVD